MKKCVILITAGLIFGRCSGGLKLTDAQLQDTRGGAEAPFDTLAAYRKMPGQPKTVEVQGYYKKDSTYIAPHKRSARSTNPVAQ